MKTQEQKIRMRKHCQYKAQKSQTNSNPLPRTPPSNSQTGGNPALIVSQIQSIGNSSKIVSTNDADRSDPAGEE